MAYTLLDIKHGVANQLGADNGATPNNKRDRIINRARRRFYSETAWKFLRDSDTLTFTSQLADLPATYNRKFDPIAVYTYSDTTKNHYTKVGWDDVDFYGEDQYVYAIDKTNNKIKINQSTVTTATLDFTVLPADAAMGSGDDTDEEPAPDIEPIISLAVALWWLASERSTGKHQMFMDEYREQLISAKRSDKATFARRSFYPYLSKYKTIPSGYRGRA